tara:strand:+ start:145 stop:555 length:411 start_codon:yes stop_codon:yes gene_type:complete
MAIRIIDLLEMVDVGYGHHEMPSIAGNRIYQTTKMHFQVAPVVEPGQPVGQRQFETVFLIAAQFFLIPPAANLCAAECEQLIAVNGVQNVVVATEVHRLDQSICIHFFRQQHDLRHRPTEYPRINEELPYLLAAVR